MEQSSEVKSSLVLYRAFDVYNRYGHDKRLHIDIQFEEYKVLEETDKTYLINLSNTTFEDYLKYKWHRLAPTKAAWLTNCKRILKDQNKYNRRYAYTTKQDALYDLQKRREKEVQHLRRRLDNIEKGLTHLKTYNIDDPVKVYDDWEFD